MKIGGQKKGARREKLPCACRLVGWLGTNWSRACAGFHRRWPCWWDQRVRSIAWRCHQGHRQQRCACGFGCVSTQRGRRHADTERQTSRCGSRSSLSTRSTVVPCSAHNSNGDVTLKPAASFFATSPGRATPNNEMPRCCFSVNQHPS